MESGDSNKVLASNNKMLWQFYSSLHRQVTFATQAADADVRKQTIALCIVKSITLVETFLNVFFQTVVNEVQFRRFSEWIASDLSGRVSLERKIKTWPKLVFDRGIDFSQGVGQKFLKLKDTRNWLM